MPAAAPPLRGLYAVTPETLCGPALYRAAEAACAGGAVLLQYRNKSSDVALRFADASALRAITTVCGTRFIINDDIWLALETGADGIHVGRGDSSPAAARDQLGAAATVGVSCYDDAALARNARHAGADYVAFGAMFPSATKPAAPLADRARFGEVADLGIARCAIGGITLAHAPALIAAGADLLAVVSDLFNAPDISAQAQAYARLF
jgi:thiamine-phosphate pyrophosphorylase